MYEIELKYPLLSPEAHRERVIEKGGVLETETEHHRDTYYGHPCRNFAETTEALRIRCVDGQAHVTYKGPKQPGVAKVREELEWSLGESDRAGENMSKMLVSLGFQPVATVSKHRQTLRMQRQGRNLLVTLDEVEEVGWYSEIEAMAVDQADIPAARDAIMGLAEELGLLNHEPRSYLKLWLDREKSSPQD